LLLFVVSQVRFVFETFKRLRPGVPLRMLHGKMKQMKRMAVFYEFCEAKVSGVSYPEC
jgi:ATP-dependent RNA helicase DDX10/DBP4